MIVVSILYAKERLRERVMAEYTQKLGISTHIYEGTRAVIGGIFHASVCGCRWALALCRYNMIKLNPHVRVVVRIIG